MYLKKLNFYILILTIEVNDRIFFKVKRKEHMRKFLGFLNQANLNNRDAWLCVTHDKSTKLIFLAILHYINRRIRSAFSKYFLLCSRKLMCLNQGSDWWSEQRFKRYSHFKFWTNILTLGRKLYENPTIYMQYGYDGFKISINIKVNQTSNTL
jgi:hypothetical protein